MQSEQINELMSALNRAQLAMVPAKKESENPFFHSRYADLSTVWDALHPFRTEGIVFTQSPQESPDGYIVLDTQMTHAASGQWIRSRLKMRVGKDDPQGYGSAITYARRYALGAMSGLVTEEDDDANAASPQPSTKDFATKFPAQAKAIQAKLATAPYAEKVAALTSVVPADPAPMRPGIVTSISRPLLPAGGWKVPVGPNAGRLLSDLTDEDVDYQLRKYLSKLSDPANAKSRFRDEWEQAVLEIRAELLARYPEAEGQP